MVFRSGRDPDQGIESTIQFGLFDESPRDVPLNESQRVEEFITGVRTALTSSLENSSRLHGLRVQNMFEAVVVALGEVRLIKLEDAGTYFFDEDLGAVRPADFRIVTKDGEHLLVEVKSLRPSGGLVAGMPTADLEAQQRYANLTGGRLLVAHYWSDLNEWTLVDSNVFARDGHNARLDFAEAMMANEMVRIGDARLGTRPPLRLTLKANANEPRATSVLSATETRFGFTIEAAIVSCEDRELVNPLERRLAQFMLMFGQWELAQHVERDEVGVTAVHWIAQPEPSDRQFGQVQAQGFAWIGSLASMYSTQFNLATLRDDRSVSRLRSRLTPGILKQLVPDDYWDRDDRRLPLWRFNVSPPET
jgi:hypothetical protein